MPIAGKFMNPACDISLAKEILRLRISQMLVNEQYKAGKFQIPIHLALGHEAIAAAVGRAVKPEDRLVLSHRNIHYNLAIEGRLRPLLDEYLLKESGLGKSRMGSMNLANEEKGVIYTSSILGNNLGVAAGAALALKTKRSNGVVFVVTGDGAMEEGSFYESMVFMKCNNLSCVVIIENNEWSLATHIGERRCGIDVEKLVSAVDATYAKFSGNRVHEYAERLRDLREIAIERRCPVFVEVELSTLGGWWVETNALPGKRYVNYHAGPASKIEFSEWPLLEKSDSDPVFALQECFDEAALRKMSAEILEALKAEIQ